jgi:hypothetical protein
MDSLGLFLKSAGRFFRRTAEKICNNPIFDKIKNRLMADIKIDIGTSLKQISKKNKASGTCLGKDEINENRNFKVGQPAHRVYWNIAEEKWCIQKVVIREIKRKDGVSLFRISAGDDWTDSASLFKNHRTAMSNAAFRTKQSHSIREVDF